MNDNHPEASICREAVRELRREGWRVVCEVPVVGRRFDAVGVRDDRCLILEAKVTFSRALRRQLYTATLYGDFVLAVVAGRPRADGVEWLQRLGIGLWLIDAAGLTRLVDVKQSEIVNQFYRKQTIEVCAGLDEETEGGFPCLRGIGIAQDVQRRVDEYRRKHPSATWKEIFVAVPNHYTNERNMYSALRSNRERLAFRARRRPERLSL